MTLVTYRTNKGLCGRASEPGLHEAAGLDPHGGAITMLPRTLDPEIASALAALPAQPGTRVSASDSDLKDAVSSALLADFIGPTWLRDWLVADILLLAGVFIEKAGAATLRLRLQTVTDNSCRKFHIDQLRYRLVSTYVGPGTQWISPAYNELLDVENAPPHIVQTVPTGWSAIMRGRLAEDEARPALMHRSPPIEGKGIRRLFLALDDPSPGVLQ